MSTSLEMLEAEVLQLPPSDRFHLLERLIAMIDLDPEVEQLWERVADQRESELVSGSIAEVQGEEALSRLRARLAQ